MKKIISLIFVASLLLGAQACKTKKKDCRGKKKQVKTQMGGWL